MRTIRWIINMNKNRIINWSKPKKQTTDIAPPHPAIDSQMHRLSSQSTHWNLSSSPQPFSLSPHSLQLPTHNYTATPLHFEFSSANSNHSHPRPQKTCPHLTGPPPHVHTPNLQTKRDKSKPAEDSTTAAICPHNVQSTSPSFVPTIPTPLDESSPVVCFHHPLLYIATQIAWANWNPIEL